MATQTIAPANAGFLLSEGDGSISRETVTLITGQNLQAGTVLAKITASGKYTILAPAASTGAEVATAVLYAAVDATSADKPAVVIARLAEVADNALIYPTVTAPQKVTAIANLALSHIIVR